LVINNSKGSDGKWKVGDESILFSFDMESSLWKSLVISDKWFKTPVDADLFQYMDDNCTLFKQNFQSIRSKLVPVTVTTIPTISKSNTVDKIALISDSESTLEPPSKRLKESISDDVDVNVDNIVNIKEENFDLDLNDLLTADEDTFNEIDTGIVEEDPLAS